MENNSAPSLSDLIALWLSESRPEKKLKVIGSANGSTLIDETGWIQGYIGDTRFYVMDGNKHVGEIEASDPEFFEKVEVALLKMRESKTRLYQVTKMSETPPSFSIAE